MKLAEEHPPLLERTESAASLPTLLKPRFDCMPTALTTRDQWVLWEASWQADKGKFTKIPRNARTGGVASVTNSTTWSSFAQARTAYERGKERYAGVGFVLRIDDPVCGVDFDACIQDGELSPKVGLWVSSLNTYTEVSPSGKGIRAFALANLPLGGRKKGDIEMYDQGRFLTVTGEQWQGSPASYNLEFVCSSAYSLRER